MRYSILDGEVFVNRSLEVVVASNIHARQQTIRANRVMGRDLWPPASIVELERGI